MDQTLLGFISGILIIAGTIGAVLPFMPGIPLALAGLWLYAILTHFEQVSLFGAIIFSLLTGATILVDVFAPVLGARGNRSSRFGTLGAMIGAVFGIFILGPIGAIAGPFIGAFIGEYLKSANTEQALKTAWGAFIGFLVGSVFKVIVGLSMFIYFLIAVL
jgi:uncharacterized protein YqgC (DUF456 family)